jgi:hypothetical protein
MILKRVFFKAFGLIILASIVQSCAIATGMNRNIFPTPVYWANQASPQPHEVIEALVLQDERYYDPKDPLKKDLLEKYGVMPKGYNYDEKEILVYQLSKKARDMGADALIDIRYSLQVGQKTYGYYISGLAVRLPQQQLMKKKNKK